MHFNYIDVIILGVILLFGIKGFHLGIIKSLFNLLKNIFSLIVCKFYYKPMSDYISESGYIFEYIKNFIKNSSLKILSYDSLIYVITKIIIDMIVVVGIFLISNIILGIILIFIERIFKFKPLNIINKFIGFIFGSIKGLIILLLILTLIHPLLSLFPKERLIVDLNNSLLLKYLYMYNFIFKYF